MKIFLNIILSVFILLCFTKNIRAQDSLKHVKWKHNHIKLGNSPIPLRLYVSYEYAVAKHFSIGTMACYNGSEEYPGYVGSLFSRFYFNKFNESGWFTELRGSYGHFSPIAYTSDYYTGSTDIYRGEHTGSIDYLFAGISGGYKVYCSRYIFFEFLGGLHFGQAMFGKDDLYLEPPVSYFIGGDRETIFNTYGPGFPLHLMISVGFAF